MPCQQLALWYNCNTVFLHWRVDLDVLLGKGLQSVAGNTVLETVRAPFGSPYPWLIDMVYTEYNSGAWMVDLDIFTPTCGSNAISR